MRSRTVLLLAAVVPVGAVAAAVALKAGSWQLSVSRYAIRLSPTPRRTCPDCKGEGGWWSEGPYPDGEMCWCWDRTQHTLRLRPLPAYDEIPF
ncbi:hypothetical protein [Streptomyces aidingensis]|uniref:Secreted protein n=1 Tax=Streptomyces aidingensis TaxID=910347 RepID=A0A1I1UUP0_9ACTN|nr:hypothetical protein [Streptomyces aidingensis]SFD74394.1 hypothetical protein SAMN05421773_12718 [Streptomyces aidingensis]